MVVIQTPLELRFTVCQLSYSVKWGDDDAAPEDRCVLSQDGCGDAVG